MDDLTETNPPARLAVLAIGGNALLKKDEVGTHREQVRAARKVARAIVELLREGYRVLVVHGNGPQVGRELLRNEEASTKVPPQPLDVCVAATQGSMGYLLTNELRNVMKAAGLVRPVACLLTQVLVSREDPAWQQATKPVGHFYSAWRARELMKTTGVHMVEDAGRGWRRVVPSPKPLDVFDLESVQVLLDAKQVVVAGGGGGVATAVDGRGGYVGLEAVVDKDRTSALLGAHLGADLLVLITAVDNVYVSFGQPGQRVLEQVSASELRELHAAGHFPPGSMGPKIEAALDFIDDGGAAVIITSPERLVAALADRAGTRVTRDPEGRAVRRQLNLFPDPDRPDDPEEAWE